MLSISRLSIPVRILIICALPMLALLAVGLPKLMAERTRAVDAEAVAHVVETAPVISALVHELQKERGTSAGFIGAKGETGGEAVAAQRIETDNALKTYRKVLPAATGRFAFAAFADPFARARGMLGELEAKRAAVDALNLSVGDMAGYYTPLIGQLLSMVESVASLTEDGQVVRSLAAYSALLQGKERAGIERAMGANGFNAGSFAPQVYRNFVGLGTMQTAYENVFRRYAPAGEVAALEAALAGAVTQDVEAMRALAYEAPFGGDISSVSGRDWFAASTVRIDALKTVEDKVAGDIVAKAGKIADDANLIFWELAIVIGGMIVVILVASYFIARSISRPIKQLSTTMRRLADNDVSVEIPGHELHDEIGEMARTVLVFRDDAVAKMEMEAEREAAKEREAQAKREAMQAIADDFAATVGSIVDSVSQAASDLKGAAEGMTSVAEDAMEKSASVASASEQTSANVQTVAAATEELGSSVDEIGRQAQASSDKAKAATAAAEESVGKVRVLSETAQKIGTIVGLIQDIAAQTNLLALNATIEAARAGEAGKGFAVVASEVKQLAEQTSHATSEIGEQIGAIQSETGASVDAIEIVTSAIRELNEMATSIAAAVEEQGVATREISANVQQAAQGTEVVNVNIAGVGQAASESSGAAANVLVSADELAGKAEMLQNEMTRFLDRIRAA